jgi:hypothetical protein
MGKGVILTRLLVFLTFFSILIASTLAHGENLSYNRYGFSEAFDSGRLGTIRPVGAGNYDLTLRVSPLGKQHSAWLNFFINNSRRSITINILNVYNIGEFTRSPPSQFVYSCDGVTWQRITNASLRSGTFRFQKRFPCSPVQVATYFPYPYSAIEQYVENKRANPFVNITTLGLSVQGRDIRMLELTNWNINESIKRQVFMVGRQHPGETSSTYIYEGVIDYVLMNTSILDRFHFYLVPAANPDGIYLGNTREQSQGLDPNRGWNSNRVQETMIVRQALDRIDALHPIDFFLDNHGYAGGEVTSQVLYCGKNASRLWDIFTRITVYKAWNDTRADSSYARGYACNVLGIDPVFVIESSQHNYRWTIPLYKEQGKNLVKALDQFYYP